MASAWLRAVGLRPLYLPAALAAAMPSRWCSSMISLSQVATAARMVRVIFDVGFRVSSTCPPMDSTTSPTLRAVSSPSIFSSSIVERASRSGFVATSTRLPAGTPMQRPAPPCRRRMTPSRGRCARTRRSEGLAPEHPVPRTARPCWCGRIRPLFLACRPTHVPQRLACYIGRCSKMPLRLHSNFSVTVSTYGAMPPACIDADKSAHG